MKNGPIALDGVSVRRFVDTSIPQKVSPSASTPRAHVLRGREAVVAHAGTLADLCNRTGQPGAMHWLSYLMATPAALEKIPTLVLIGVDSDVDPDEATADTLAGAVLLYEYKVAGCGTKVFATDDTTGQRTVIAPLNIRTQIAEEACRVLIDEGALAAMISFEGTAGLGDRLVERTGLKANCRMATRYRSVPRYLPMADTVEDTLAMLGRHTRRNLRYYRRRAETELGAEFEPEVAMRREEFLAINQVSMNPVTEELASWRYDAIQRTAGSLFCGVRSREGRWLSLIGGRRYMRVTEIDWQMNVAGLPRHSLSTVMRAYMLDYEVNLGTRRLAFTGGTPHPMRHSFVCVDAVDVIALRHSPDGWLLRMLARWLFPPGNFLSQALRDKQLRWGRW
jgi:hypothetical protein